MSSENSELIDLLDAEFVKLRNEEGPRGKSKYLSIKDMAHFLEISATLLSRYRSGDRPVSARQAHKIAAKFRRDPGERQSFADIILAAKPVQNQEEVRVSSWFEKCGHPGFLLLVQFFEPPVVTTTVSGRLAIDLAKAIANGLSYGIMLPFSSDEKNNVDLPVQLQIYLLNVEAGVKALYADLIRLTLDAVAESWEADGEDQGEYLRDLMWKATGRLKVFTLQGTSPITPTGSLPAIGNRLFYCRNFANDASEAEIWQWNTTPTGDTMLLRRAEDFEVAAMETLLYPLPQWMAKDGGQAEYRLPSNEEMNGFHADNRPAVTARKAPKRLRWYEMLVEDEESLDSLINKKCLECTEM